MSDQSNLEGARELGRRLKGFAVRLQKEELFKQGDNTELFQRAMALWHEETGKAVRQFENHGGHFPDDDEIDSRVVLRIKEEMGRSAFSQGYHPRPGERLMLRDEWKRQSRETRKNSAEKIAKQKTEPIADHRQRPWWQFWK